MDGLMLIVPMLLLAWIAWSAMRSDAPVRGQRRSASREAWRR